MRRRRDFTHDNRIQLVICAHNKRLSIQVESRDIKCIISIICADGVLLFTCVWDSTLECSIIRAPTPYFRPVFDQSFFLLCPAAITYNVEIKFTVHWSLQLIVQKIMTIVECV